MTGFPTGGPLTVGFFPFRFLSLAIGWTLWELEVGAYKYQIIMWHT